MSRPQTTIATPLTLILAAAVLAGCTNTQWRVIDPPIAAKRVQAVPVDYAHTVTFEAGDERLSDQARADLETFLARTDARGALKVVVSSAATSQQTFTGALAKRRLDRVAAYTRLLGVDVLVSDTAVAVAEEGAPGGVRLAVSQVSVNLPACPDWTDWPGSTFSNNVHTNWGCANAVNLGMMVARPADLIRGRDPGATDGEYGVLGFQRYRAGEKAPLEPEDMSNVTGASEDSGDATGGAGG